MIILWCITQCCVKAHLKEALAVTSCMPKRSSVNIALVWNGAENRHYCPIDPKTSPPSFHRCHGHATCPGRPSPFVPVGFVLQPLAAPGEEHVEIVDPGSSG